MADTDIVIVGGGLAGSVAAAILGRAGIATTFIDIHTTYPPDFRVEKFHQPQHEMLVRTGLDADAFKRIGTPITEMWIGRLGHLVDKMPNHEYSMSYENMVNAARAQIPANVKFIRGRVQKITATENLQRVDLADFTTITARLIVLATGVNNNILREQVGVSRHDISKADSLNFGFDIVPKNGGEFPFKSLTYHTESVSTRMGYICMFPMGDAMRVNLFAFRDIRDPWAQKFSEAPEASVFSVMPRLRKVMGGGFTVTSKVLQRPVDLYVTEGYRRPGVVLIGDAFANSSPPAGTGLDKLLTDAARLCNVYIPEWLSTPGMGTAKVEAFYDDVHKVAADDRSRHLAHYIRAVAINREAKWRVRRVGWFGFQASQYMMRSLGVARAQGGEA